LVVTTSGEAIAPRAQNPTAQLLEYLRRGGKIVSRDCSIRLPRVHDDETQHPPAQRPSKKRPDPRVWVRWIAGFSARRSETPQSEASDRTASHEKSKRGTLHDTLMSLPQRLDGSSLPNGVVELLIEDIEAVTRQLLDIHDGRVTPIDPGKCVPWVSIAGPPSAWALALGPERDTSALRLTGDRPLADLVLAALPRHE
jgi:hypothetical protein